MWKERLLEKARMVKENFDLVSIYDQEITNKIILTIESGDTPTWKAHKTFTAARVRLLSKLGEIKAAERKKSTKPNYWLTTK